MLKGKTAIITGASQGLGKIIAREFLKEGASLALIARNEHLLRETASELSPLLKERQEVLIFPGDVSNDGQMQIVFKKIFNSFKKIHILVNNAGIYGPKGPIESVDLTEWKQTIDINLLGTLIPMRLIMGHFKSNHYGKIINLSGGGATKPLPMLSAYAASKIAVVRLTETVSKEVENFKIDVNAIAPGALNTRLLDEVLAAGPEKIGEEFYRQSISQRASGGDSLETAAQLCVFLASSKSDGISGRLISAVWDKWNNLQERKDKLLPSEIYTLRRITAKDRGYNWDS